MPTVFLSMVYYMPVWNLRTYKFMFSSRSAIPRHNLNISFTCTHTRTHEVENMLHWSLNYSSTFNPFSQYLFTIYYSPFAVFCCWIICVIWYIISIFCLLQLTGRHMVRDVFCKNCDTKLGWMYVSVNKNPSFEFKSKLEDFWPPLSSVIVPSLRT